MPVEHDGQFSSRLCSSALEIRDWARDTTGGVNTFKLCNDERNGYWDWLFPLECLVFSKVGEFQNSPDFSFDRLESFQNLIARQVVDSIDNWHPAIPVTERFELLYSTGRIIIFWEPVIDDFRGRETGALGYNVFRNDMPFREADRGEFIGFTETPDFVDTLSIGCAYYRVEVVF